MTPSRRWWRVGAAVLTTSGVLYLLWAFRRAGTAPLALLGGTPARAIAIAVGLETLVLLGGAAVWHATVRMVGVHATMLTTLGAWWRASLARFVPGKIWPFVAMAAHGRVTGFPAMQLPAALAVHSSFALGAAMIVTLATARGPNALLAAMVMLAVVGALLHPRVATAVWRSAGSLLGLEQTRWHGSWGRALTVLGAQVVLWVAHGGAFLVLASGVVDLPAGATPAIIGALAGSYIAGAVGSLAPAGLIVRDATLAALLASIVPADAAATLTVLARLWSLAAEGVAIVFAIVLSRLGNRTGGTSRGTHDRPITPVTRARGETGASARARDVAVVIPAFDEAENVDALFAELRGAFARHRIDGEIVFVDDGSTDDTFAIAQREAERGRVRVLRHARNRGKTEALLTGAAATFCDRIVLFDADLQHDPDDIPRLLAPLDDGWDIVTGRKVGSYQKRVVSLVYNALSRRIFRVPVRDLNSIKAFRRDVLDTVALRHDWHRYLVALAVARGFAVTEVDVALRPRRAGRSKYAGVARVFSGCRDLAAVWWHLRFDRSARA